MNLSALPLFLLSGLLTGKSLLISGKDIHLRSGQNREWKSFPEAAQAGAGNLSFRCDESNPTEYTLVLRQRDVKKANWTVSINRRKLGTLQDDERSMVRVLAVPAGALQPGTNTLEVTGDPAGFSDDITIRDIRIEPLALERYLRQSTISIAAAGQEGPMPVKIAVADAEGALVPFASLRTGAYEAQRTGILYTADGLARIAVPPGDYRVYASRGFEYSAPYERVHARGGDVHAIRLTLRKEVNLSGYLGGDPHVHTFELSRHGDASVDERVLTAAGEGLDWIVSTEHNRADDYSPVLQKRHIDKWLRTITGNEVTTATGHFNIFPVRPGTSQPDPKLPEWSALMNKVYAVDGVQVVVQNHPRDLHSNYRPFDPAHHLSSIGANQNDRPVRANAMEVVNSGAMSTDVMQLVRDWLGLLTRGLPVAAIGSSDTHTVDFVPIGQARTYVQSDGSDLFSTLAKGRNLVSYGLAAELRADGSQIEAIVHGPSWSSVDRVEIYSNGKIVWQDTFAPVKKPGVKYRRKVQLNLPRHDRAVVAVASGPGVLEPFWEVRKPYQPMSDEWTPRVLGISAALWIDEDTDGKITAPQEYAGRLVKQCEGDFQRLLESLASYDRAVAMHAFEILRTSGKLPSSVALERAPEAIRNAYAEYAAEVGHLRR